MHAKTFSLQGKYWCGSQCERVNGFRAAEGAGGCGCRSNHSKILSSYRGKKCGGMTILNFNLDVRSSNYRYDTVPSGDHHGEYSRSAEKYQARSRYVMIPIPTVAETVIAFGGKVRP